MAVYIVNNTSSGVPQFSSTNPGVFINVFDYLLVTLMGWSKPFVNSNNTIAVYRSPSGTHQRYLRIDNSSSTVAIANSYERMNDLNTGYNKSPSIYLYKKNNNNEWYFHSNGKIFWFSWNANNNYFSSFMFGDFTSYVQGDEYNTIIAGKSDNNNYYEYLQQVSSCLENPHEWKDHYIMRSFIQVGFNVTAIKVSMLPFAITGQMGKGSLPYPHLADNSLKMCRMYLVESGNNIRGHIPGIWIPMHNFPLEHNYEFQGGNGNLAGRSFKTFRKPGTYEEFEYFYETSDTWES